MRLAKAPSSGCSEFVPLLAFDAEIPTVVCSTNAIESVNARIGRAVRGAADRPRSPASAAPPRRV
uniref:transposase n=1 Tax=Micromonospora echinaurantiaca TaxID=47857 RepID=UPI0038CC0637